MSSHRNPTSLQVQARSSTISASPTHSTTANQDAVLLRESQQFRRDMEREVERWMDVLMESPAVDRRFLRRASLYLQPNLYDEVSHERHLAMLCSYPTCNKRPRRAYSEDARWRITNTTTHNISLRGPNRRDVVQVAGNPEDGFCGAACAIRSRWFRSRLDLEPVWARQNIDVGDLKAYQAQVGRGRLPDAVPDEVDLLEDMEERGEIVIEDGQIRRLESTPLAAGTIQEPSEVTHDEGSEKEENEEPVVVAPQKTEPLPKTQLVAETHAQPSTFMQRLENTLASLRIVEKTPNTEQSQSERPISDVTQRSADSSDGPTSSAFLRSGRTGTPLAETSSVNKADESGTLQPAPASTPSRFETNPSRRNGQKGRGEIDFEDESEDEETRKVFDLALAARRQLEDGNF